MTRWILLISTALTACAHTSRMPAADIPKGPPPALTCSDIFHSTFDPLDLEQKFEMDQYVYRQIRDYVDQKYEGWVNEFVRRTGTIRDCEAARDAELYAADINSKGGRFSARVKKDSDSTSSQAILSNPIFNDPKTAEQLSCYAECAYRQSQASTFSKQTCQQKCGTSDLLTNYYEDSLEMKRIAAVCFKDPRQSKLKRQEFKELYVKTVPDYLVKLASVQSTLRTALETDQRIVTKLIRLKADFDKFRGQANLKCGPPIYSWAAGVFGASVDLRTVQDKRPRAKRRNDNEGTGFYFTDTRGRLLATAAHVPEPNPDVRDVTRALMDVLKPEASAQNEIIEFPVRPGLIDLGKDVTLALQAAPGPALTLVSSDEIPEYGQRFYITGYPSGMGNKFAAFPCSFLGFGPRLEDGNQKDGSYFLNCPGTPDLHGISGGATVDSKGRVWGVNVTSLPYLSIFIVSPISQDAGGQARIGIQKTFMSSLCYNSFTEEPHRCQVMPSMYEKDVP